MFYFNPKGTINNPEPTLAPINCEFGIPYGVRAIFYCVPNIWQTQTNSGPPV